MYVNIKYTIKTIDIYISYSKNTNTNCILNCDINCKDSFQQRETFYN